MPVSMDELIADLRAETADLERLLRPGVWDLPTPAEGWSVRDQITHLHDLNNDGEADFYENFNNDCQVSPSFHEFTFDLQRDSKGNFYYSKAGPVKPGGRGWQTITANNGAILKVSPDGKNFSVYASGLRAPNGVGVGPNGELVVSDNQGNWIPSSKVNWVKRGGSYGFAPHSKRDDADKRFDPPMLWLPHSVDRSTGQPSWVTSDNFGLPRGTMLLTSYGNASLFIMLHEDVGGRKQAGAVRIPVLMLAAARDEIVDSTATETLGLRMRTGRHLMIPGARHELFMETDPIRGQVLAAFDAFITEQSG